MSVPSDVLDEVGTWSLENELRESGFIDEMLAGIKSSADTPPSEGDTPASAKGPETPPATEEPKAEGDAPDSGDRTYSEEQYQRSRATANKERDEARKVAEERQSALDQARKDLAENEFQRGVQLRTIQLTEQLTMQKGALDLADFRACQMQAYREMQQARDQVVEADLQRVQEEAGRAEMSQRDVDATQQKAENLFLKRSMNLQKEAASAGVPTFDAQTALQDVLYLDSFQEEIQEIAYLPPDKQEKAALRLYERAEAQVRSKYQALVTARDGRTPPPHINPNTLEATPDFPTRQFSNGAAGFDVDAMLERTFSNENYIQTLQAHPHLQRGN